MNSNEDNAIVVSHKHTDMDRSSSDYMHNIERTHNSNKAAYKQKTTTKQKNKKE
jgi:hypothetical protein